MDDASEQNDVWNIDLILSNIFAYTNQKDLLEFNTVCKKWNSAANPITHKTIKLTRSWDIVKQSHSNVSKKFAKIDADVVECILNNAKHAPFVKEFKYSYKLYPQRAIEVFETFRFISSLTIENSDMTQDQFLGMINPLTQLQELTLSSIGIKTTIRKWIYKESIQLPQTLKRLSLFDVRLIGNPELFVQTMNSHNNLVNFFIRSNSSYVFLEAFYKYYPSLLNFGLDSFERQTHKLLYGIFENNPQLISLKLPLECMNSELVSHISTYLANLERLNLQECDGYSHKFRDVNLKFSQPTKIKKLNLLWNNLSIFTLNLTLLNCPNLEELSLNRVSNYEIPNSFKFINNFNSAKLKKLFIGHYALSECSFESIFSSCPYISELDIKLPAEWKEAIKSIYENCANLEKLNLFPPYGIYGQELNTFFREFYESEFFTSNPKCKSTLTHLTLNYFNIHVSNAEHYKNFEKLKSIKCLKQFRTYYNTLDQKARVDMNLWPGYEIISKETGHRYNYDVELKRL
jgi:hypothetical protein